MNTLILFGTKHGTTETCAMKLKDKIKGKVQVCNIKEGKDIDLNEYENIILGGSIYVGMLNKDIKEFIDNNKELLINKNFGLFMCCMSDGDKIKEQFEQNVDKEILEASKINENFGGEFRFSKMNFFKKKIIKMISKKDPSLGEINGKTDFSKINDNAINKFAVIMSEK